MLRTALFAFLAAALVATVWAHCPVGATAQPSHDHAEDAHHAHDQGKHDCDGKEARACDAMVQAAPSQMPTLVAVGGWSAPYFETAPRVRFAVPMAASSIRARPPDRVLRFKDISARTGRLLI